jgi:hypothetical protein
VRADGSLFHVAVNLDGQGGELQLPAGPLKLGRYEWRVLSA